MADLGFDQSILEELKRLDGQAKSMQADIDDLKEELSRVDLRGMSLAEAMLATQPDRAGDVPSRFRPAGKRVARDLGMTEAPGQQAPQTERPAGRKRQVSHGEMVEWCTEILRENGGEMHITDIKEALEAGADNGWRVPGAGHESNVSVHLARSEEFEKTGERGVWRLAEGRDT